MIPFPNPEPIIGSRVAPKTTITINKIIESSPIPNPNNSSKEISNSIAEKIGRKIENHLDLFTQLRYLKDKF